MSKHTELPLPVSYSAGPLGEYDEVGYLLDAEGVVLSRFDRTNGGDEIGALLCNFVNAHGPMLDALKKARADIQNTNGAIVTRETIDAIYAAIATAKEAPNE